MAGVWIILVAVAGAAAGWRTGKVRSQWWLIGFFAPLALVMSITAVRHFPMLRLYLPMHPLVAGSNEFFLLALAGPVMIFSLMPRLPRKNTRWLLGTLCAIWIGWFCDARFIAPYLNREMLLNLQTQIDPEGVCLQTTDFTCGPAAAVTALRQLGIHSLEGEMAVLLHTSRAGGTEPDLATEYLNERYGPEGIHCEYRVARSIAELPANAQILAVIKYTFFNDHVVELTHDGAGHVTVRDPITGTKSDTVQEFDKKFRGEAVVITRAAPLSTILSSH
jgi:hypothetical protein